jgi:pyruvate,water dikinase
VGWAPYFTRAAGLATEIGSPLSHGAVVAREYGLPAVVNLPGATKRFKTGDMVRLDGNTGELRRVG